MNSNGIISGKFLQKLYPSYEDTEMTLLSFVLRLSLKSRMALKLMRELNRKAMGYACSQNVHGFLTDGKILTSNNPQGFK